MDAKTIIRQLIREELKKALQEAIQRSAEPLISEAKFTKGQKPANAGKRGEGKAKGTGKSGKYTSAGTLPSSIVAGKNGKPDKSGRSAKKRSVDAGTRDAIGKKLLNAYARGNVRGTGNKKGEKAAGSASFRKNVKNKAQKEFGNTSRKSINSVIWAIASVKAAHSGKKKDGGSSSTPKSKASKKSAPKAPPTGNQP